MTTIKELLDDLQNLTNTKISYSELGNVLGTGRANISLRVKNQSQVTFDELKKIEQAYNVVLNNLKDENSTIKLDYYPDMFGSCGNGVFELSQTKEQLIVPKKAFFTRFSPTKKYSVINAYGDSMQPFIYDKDKLIVEHWEGEQIIDNRPYIFCYKDEIFIKRLVKNVNQLVIVPENKLYDTIKLSGKDLKDVNIIGQIVGLMRDLR